VVVPPVFDIPVTPAFVDVSDELQPPSSAKESAKTPSEPGPSELDARAPELDARAPELDARDSAEVLQSRPTRASFASGARDEGEGVRSESSCIVVRSSFE
jgi:hypothetical protein